DGRIVAQARSFAEDLIVFDSEAMQGDMHEQTAVGDASAYAALVLGTRDYVQKCGFSKVVIGLSGGIDSALTAAIAVDALGKENVTGVAMPSQYSSEHSIKDARELACKLGIRFEVVPIGAIFDEYRKSLATLFAGTQEGVAEENIQSRIRGNILMAFSNKFGALVLTTGNKSELGVGYCTLYGDMVGGLGVISDVPKTMVYSLSRYANSLRPIIPQSTIDKPPSAELRPGQKDSDTLPPYEVLDNILEDYVEDYHSAERIAADRGYDVRLVREVIRMIERSEYKRQQAAPGLKITPKAFGLGRRFPIAQKSEV
ncbi:MAG TPA: NAD(+) synthase, partial [Verrucomicrobiae bacterium]|nr:NAD(+) synthase [Verrucomicrobiae bacterium]